MADSFGRIECFIIWTLQFRSEEALWKYTCLGIYCRFTYIQLQVIDFTGNRDGELEKFTQ